MGDLVSLQADLRACELAAHAWLVSLSESHGKGRKCQKQYGLFQICNLSSAKVFILKILVSIAM